MIRMNSVRFFLFVYLISALFFSALPGQSAQPPEADALTATENITIEQLDSVLARLSDEQVRSLLQEELSKDISSRADIDSPPIGLFSFVVGWLHIMDVNTEQDMEERVEKILTHLVYVPGDLAGIFGKLGDTPGYSSAWRSILGLFAIFLIALGVEFLFKKFTVSFRRQFQGQNIPDLSGLTRIWAGIMREIPAITHVVIYGSAAFLLFIFSPMSEQQSVRLLFLAVLFSILFIRIFIFISELFCSPRLATLRLLPLNDNAAEKFHEIMQFFSFYIGIGISFIALIAELGIPHETLILLTIGIGSILLFSIAIMVMRSRQAVAGYILSGETVDTGSNWVMRQFALLWHVPALLYLFLVWIIFMFQEVMGTSQNNSSFFLSLLVVPIFLLLDRMGQWVVQTTIRTLKIYNVDEEENIEEEDPETPNQEQMERLLIIRVGRIIRLVILFALGGWIMNLWGYELPFAANIIKIIFRSLVTMTLALFVWRVVSGYIERKIMESEPEEEEKEEQDDEWGSAAQRGRGYTLLPMVRKFLGTVLIVMVTLIILSTIGVEIGPLLAGAGVIGIALGFGAQKLVSDILSGFFYLLDDAFRVGEYLQAGSVSGAVEAITLRNIMLRHHRGMLQIVPYSELGPITNFMRGGIVVKFNLEFPYDTDVDKVRKIIKKVGQAMLQDEEFGKDFIRPVKSQGVREITNSVMIIRVKFTAQPGTHFVIRREAYRRITDALAAKGINYAHRKVIVEVPEGDNGENENTQKVAEAGAAAGLAAMAADEEKRTKEGGEKPTPGMPGM